MALSSLPGQNNQGFYKKIAVLIPAVFYLLLWIAGVICLSQGLMTSSGYVLFNFFFMFSVVFALCYSCFAYFLAKTIWVPLVAQTAALVVCVLLFWSSSAVMGISSFPFKDETIPLAPALFQYGLRTLLFADGVLATIAFFIKAARKALDKD